VFSPILIEARNPGPMTGRGNNTYLLVGSRGDAALVDAGVGEARHLAELERHLSEPQASLDRVLVTHAHPDHASGAPALAVRYPSARFQKKPWPGEDARFPVPWEPIDDLDALEIAGETLIVLHTPGHSPDHVVLWHEPSRTVFTGDLVTAGSSVMIQTSRGGNLIQYLDALERIRALAPLRLLPAHGPEVTRPADLLTRYLEHRRLRERQVLAALGSGLDTVQAIAESIYDGLSPALMPAARENVSAHLEKLQSEGTAVEENGRWKI
jgi:glyoxylase-like metal-dependent hydrolase (beta-lactamase superfamily II)